MKRISPDQLAPLISAVGQRRVAEAIGVSQTLLSLWLSGQRSLSDEKYQLLVAALREQLDEWRAMLRTSPNRRPRRT